MSELNELIEKVDALKKEIDALRPISEEIEKKIWQKYRLDWNFHSNNLEGNSLSFGETKSFLLHGITAEGKPLKDHLDIKGHNEAILLLEDVVKQKRPLNETFIRELHELILHEPYLKEAITPDGTKTSKKIEIGQYQKTPNHVKTSTGEIFYFAPPEETPAKMDDLLSWLTNAKENNLPPLTIAAEFHYRFVRIHPFDDGNGRMSRILMNLIFMSYGYPPVIIKTNDKINYFKNLQLADGGNITPFILYIGDLLKQSIELYLRGVQGENIEDEDDIDKEIALLKAKLQQETHKIILDTKTINAILNNSITPFFETLFSKLNQFDELFNRKSIKMAYFNEKSKSFYTVAQYPDSINFIKQLNSYLLSQYKLKTFKITID
ncbi:MAG: Fic family protein, partial [Chitinophagaceae bacterium]|nr:Fic family protein [Chitinophagaceae bacterium]